MGITRPRDNGKDFTSARSDLWMADDGHRPEQIAVTPRIGINVAVDEPLRFVIAGNPVCLRSRKSADSLFRIVPAADVGRQLA